MQVHCGRTYKIRTGIKNNQAVKFSVILKGEVGVPQGSNHGKCVRKGHDGHLAKNFIYLFMKKNYS